MFFIFHSTFGISRLKSPASGSYGSQLLVHSTFTSHQFRAVGRCRYPHKSWVTLSISPVILTIHPITLEIYFYIFTLTHIYINRYIYIYTIHIHIYPITPPYQWVYLYLYIHTPQNPMIYRHTPSIQWPLSSYPLYFQTQVYEAFHRKSFKSWIPLNFRYHAFQWHIIHFHGFLGSINHPILGPHLWKTPRSCEAPGESFTPGGASSAHLLSVPGDGCWVQGR